MPQTLKIQIFKFSELEGAARNRALEWGRKVSHENYSSEFLTEIFEEQLKDRGYEFDEPKIGFRTYWSLSSCQGDGVAFYGRLDLDELAKKDPVIMHLLRKAARLVTIRYRGKTRTPFCEAASNVDCWTFNVEIEGSNGHYHHWNSMNVTCQVDIHDDPKDCLDPVLDGPYDEKRERIYWTKPFKEHPPKFYGLPDISLEIEEHIQERVQEISRELEKMGYDDIEYRTSDEVVIEFIEANEYDFDEDGDRTVTL